MPFLDAALKVVRLLSAVVWLLVGLITLWGTWITFRELGPYLRTLTSVVQGAGPRGVKPSLPEALASPEIQRLLERIPSRK